MASKSSSTSNEYSSTATRYQNKIDEYETAIYNYQTVWKTDKENEIEKIKQDIKKLRSIYSNYSKIDSLRTASKNITNKIKQLEIRKLKIRKIINTFPKRIKDLDDCIKYYKNKLDKNKSSSDNKNKSSSTKCIYSRKK